MFKKNLEQIKVLRITFCVLFRFLLCFQRILAYFHKSKHGEAENFLHFYFILFLVNSDLMTLPLLLLDQDLIRQ